MKVGFLIIIGIAMVSLLGQMQSVDAESCIYVDRNSPCIDSKYLEPSENDADFTLSELSWKQASFPMKNGIGFVTAVLQDPDLNDNPSYKEVVRVFVHSDSDKELHIIELQETHNNSGIFERKFGISDSRSAPNVISVQEGDTLTVMYIDSTMPLGHSVSDGYLIHHAIIGSTGPPLERVLASNARITDIHKTINNFPNVDEQILLTSDIISSEDHDQIFVWIVQVTDSNNRIETLSWINGTLSPMSSFSPTTSWIPKHQGDYNVIFFVWESLTNPNALSPPIELEFTVNS